MIIFLVNSIEHLGREAVLAQNSGSCGVLASGSTCEQSSCCLSTDETLSSRLPPVRRRVLKPPELWRGGFEAKANFGSAALLLS